MFYFLDLHGIVGIEARSVVIGKLKEGGRKWCGRRCVRGVRGVGAGWDV